MDYVANNLISGPMRKTTECIGFQPSWAPIWRQGAKRRAAECSPDFQARHYPEVQSLLRSNHSVRVRASRTAHPLEHAPAPNESRLAAIVFYAAGGFSCRRTLRRELWICRPPLYSMKPSFLNLFMNSLIRGRVVPTISARTS
jgi:hypothetical protein